MNFTLFNSFILVIALTHSTLVLAQNVYGEFPERINAGERYVFYSHGLIVEGADPEPEHPEYGIYEFPQIKMKLIQNESFHLIAHHRPADTDILSYALTLSAWVHQLIEAGVPAKNITLIGFSRGAYLTAHAAAILGEEDLNIVLMASCFNGTINDFQSGSPLRLTGNLLSLYETTDSAGSCSTLAKDSDLSSFKEVAISTGKRHGAFYSPRLEWLAPVKSWLNR